MLSPSQETAYKEIIMRACNFEVPGNTIVYRAQVGVEAKHSKNSAITTEEQTPERSQFGRQPLSEARMSPTAKHATSGRANAEGIAVLYCASDIKTALLECRCPGGTAVTVSEWSNPNPLRLADFRVPANLTDWVHYGSQFWKRVQEEVALYFNSRVIGDYARSEYVLTQHIADQVRWSCFDGLIFSSSQGDGDNYALFQNRKNFEIGSRYMVKIDSVDLSFSPLQSI